jgi:hypothetical protein
MTTGVSFECLQFEIGWPENPPKGLEIERGGTLEGSKIFFHKAEARTMSPIEFLWAWAIQHAFETPGALAESLFDPAQAGQFAIVERTPEAVDFAFLLEFPDEPFLIRTNMGERPFRAVQFVFRVTRPPMH